MTEMTALEQIVTNEDLLPYDDTDGGKEHRAHIVSPPENRHILEGPNVTAHDIVDLARISGEEVVALCGYKWVPKRNPDKYAACKQCMDIAAQILNELGE